MSETIRIALCGTLNGIDQVRNIFTVQDGAASVPGATAISGWLTSMLTTSNLMTYLSSALVFDRYVVEVPTGTGKWQYVFENAVSFSGQNATDRMPNQVAAVVIGVTASRRRGKKFFSGLPEAEVTNGAPSTNLHNALQGFGNAWIAGFTDGANQWNAGVCKPDGTDFLQFIAARVDPLVGTQRRRKPGVGS